MSTNMFVGMSKMYVDKHLLTYVNICRDDVDPESSDTVNTDPDNGWGGLGQFEYSMKGLPHALVHARELVETGGHHGAYCTSTDEAGHKLAIKQAAKFSRTYSSLNDSQQAMFTYVLRQSLWSSVILRNTKLGKTNDNVLQHQSPQSCSSDNVIGTNFKLWEPLHYTDDWSNLQCVRDRPPPQWGATFLSKQVLITRTELLVLMRTKLEMEPTWKNVVHLTKLKWECFGSVTLNIVEGVRRKVVGTSSTSPGRRDFVRLNGIENNTVLSAQVVICLPTYIFDISTYMFAYVHF